VEETTELDCIRRGDGGQLAGLKEETGCIKRGDQVDYLRRLGWIRRGDEGGLLEETGWIKRGDADYLRRRSAQLEETKCIT